MKSPKSSFTTLRNVWKFLNKPLPHRFAAFILVVVTSYFALGVSLVTNPSILLFKSNGLEEEAGNILKSEGIDNPPSVYILPKAIKRIFSIPYSVGFKITVGRHYQKQIDQSYARVEASAIVMQEEEAGDRWILAHEVGHFVDYYQDPAIFKYKSEEEKEAFAFHFQDQFQKKEQSKAKPLH